MTIAELTPEERTWFKDWLKGQIEIKDDTEGDQPDADKEGLAILKKVATGLD